MVWIFSIKPTEKFVSILGVGGKYSLTRSEYGFAYFYPITPRDRILVNSKIFVMTSLSPTESSAARFLAKTTHLGCKTDFPNSQFETVWHSTCGYRSIEPKMPDTIMQRHLPFINWTFRGLETIRTFPANGWV